MPRDLDICDHYAPARDPWEPRGGAFRRWPTPWYSAGSWSGVAAPYASQAARAAAREAVAETAPKLSTAERRLLPSLDPEEAMADAAQSIDPEFHAELLEFVELVCRLTSAVSPIAMHGFRAGAAALGDVAVMRKTARRLREKGNA